MKEGKELFIDKYWYLFVSFFGVSVLFLLASDFLSTKFTPEVIILIITAIAVSWYSFETVALREIQRKAYELSITPVLNIFEDPRNSRVLYIKNVSNNFAKNIHLQNVIFDNCEPGGSKFSFSLSKNYLSPDDRGIPIVINYNGKPVSLLEYKVFVRINNEKATHMEITCEDIGNNKHRYIMESYLSQKDEIEMNMIY